jgi:uncharacterized DUF497 family protein
MNFRWDENKREENWQSRRVDFAEAIGIIDDPEVIESLDTREDYGEKRIRALGKTGGVHYLVAYAWRDETRLIITAWNMAKDDTKPYSRADIAAMKARGEVRATSADAPEVELDEAFWDRARIVGTRPRRKASVHLRLDPDTLEFYRSAGRGHLTRMVEILKAYADTQTHTKHR